MFTGKLLFNGDTNNQSLKQMMVLKGPFSMKMLKKAEFVDEYFDLNSNQFMYIENDKITQQVKFFSRFGAVNRLWTT
jgi:serine/threonine-protein kinase PRP4